MGTAERTKPVFNWKELKEKFAKYRGRKVMVTVVFAGNTEKKTGCLVDLYWGQHGPMVLLDIGPENRSLYFFSTYEAIKKIRVEGGEVLFENLNLPDNYNPTRSETSALWEKYFGERP